MHKIKNLCVLMLAVASVGAGGYLFASSSNGKVERTVSRTPSIQRALTPTTPDFDTSEELTRKDMTSYIESVTSTSTSRSVTFSLNSFRTIGYPNAKSNVYLVADDDNFTGKASDPFVNPDLGNEFDGYTISIVNKRGSDTIYLPETYDYAKTFKIKNNYVASGTLSFADDYLPDNPSTSENEEQWNNIYTRFVIIPDYISDIRSEAFAFIPHDTYIICQFSSKPAGWADDWAVKCGTVTLDENGNPKVETVVPDTDAHIIWAGSDFSNIDFAAEEFKDLGNADDIITNIGKNRDQTTGSNTKAFNDEDVVNYVAGYLNTDDETFEFGSYPLYCRYQATINGETKTENVALDLTENVSRNSPYDIVGKVGTYNLTVVVDIPVVEGEEIDYESFWFYNIYEAVKQGSDKNYRPLESKQYKIKCVRTFKEEININEIVTYTPGKVKFFASHTLVSLEINKVTPYFYNTKMAEFIEQYSEEISTGKYRVRYCVYNINNSYYRITYKNAHGVSETITYTAYTPLPVVELSKDKGNHFTFMFDDNRINQLAKWSGLEGGYTPERLEKIEIIGFTLNLHLWNNSSNTIVSRTNYDAHFGEIVVFDRAVDNISYVNFNLILVLIMVGYAIIYAGAAVGLFFFLKEKYKNDEFRRMKPKQYLKKAIIGFLGLAVIVLAVTSIIFRFGVFANAVAAFNPADIFVVFGGIVSIVVIGYFAKYFISVYRASKQRKKALKLKLNEDVADDGTK